MSENFELIGHFSTTVYEKPDNYKKNGYPPIVVGDYLADIQTVILQKIGNGNSCTVWLGRDGDRFVAIKMVKASDSTGDHVIAERKVLRLLTANDTMKEYAESVLTIPEYIWVYTSPNGRHHGHILPVMGPSLEDAIISSNIRQQLPAAMYHDDRRRIFSQKFAKSCLLDMLTGLELLHHVGAVHSDFRIDQMLVDVDQNAVKHPEGGFVTVQLIPKLGQAANTYPPEIYANKSILDGIADIPKCKLGDFGSAFVETNDNSGLSMTCNWEYQAPELIHCHKFQGTKVELIQVCSAFLRAKLDIWSLGIAIHQVMTHKNVFNWLPVGLEYDDNTARIMLLCVKRLECLDCEEDAMGLKEWYKKVFDVNQEVDADMEWLHDITNTTPLRESMMVDLPVWMGEEDKKEMIRIVQWCFAYNPVNRPTVEQLMADKWLGNWLSEA